MWPVCDPSSTKYPDRTFYCGRWQTHEQIEAKRKSQQRRRAAQRPRRETHRICERDGCNVVFPLIAHNRRFCSRQCVAVHARETATPCSFPGCGKPARRKGLCAGHCSQQERHGLLRPIGTRSPLTKAAGGCTFPGCDKPYWARGYCSGHLAQLKKGNRPLRPLGLGQERPQDGRPNCERCGGDTNSGGTPYGRQRWDCQSCGHTFTVGGVIRPDIKARDVERSERWGTRVRRENRGMSTNHELEEFLQMEVY